MRNLTIKNSTKRFLAIGAAWLVGASILLKLFYLGALDDNAYNFNAFFILYYTVSVLIWFIALRELADDHE